MKRNYINISALLLLLLCFSAQVPAQGTEKKEFTVNDIFYRITSENLDEVFVIDNTN